MPVIVVVLHVFSLQVRLAIAQSTRTSFPVELHHAHREEPELQSR